MKKPDFFIVGAVRSGTTALYTYLGKHPEIFMPKTKEPFYFGSDLHNTNRSILEKYLSLFTEVREEKRVGEASTAYLLSKKAAVEIKKFNPSARIIIMLRNPVDLLHSWHNYRFWQGLEGIENFEDALNAEKKRNSAVCTGLEKGLTYREHAKYPQQVQRYLEVFGRKNVHIIIYDDFKSDTTRIYRETLHFLDVDSDFQPEFQIVNPRKSLLNQTFHNFLVNPPQIVRWVSNATLPRPLLQKLFVSLRRLNTRFKPPSAMNPELRRRLQAEFSPEVERLSELLGRDLSHWSKENHDSRGKTPPVGP